MNQQRESKRTPMSYDLYICIPPLPQNDEEAWKQLDQLFEAQGPQPEVFHELITRLLARFPSSMSDENVDTGVWSLELLWDCIGHRITQLFMTYPSVAEVVPFVIETARNLKLDVFEPQLGWIYRHDGINKLQITIEGKPNFEAPTAAQLSEAVERMTPKGGPGYLILEDEREDYTQVAGGDGTFSAEWREYSEGEFRHFVAGNTEQSSDREVQINTNGAFLTVKENEQLTAPDITEILMAFTRKESRPDRFTWRDITTTFS
jgi:hypothetical protein